MAFLSLPESSLFLVQTWQSWVGDIVRLAFRADFITNRIVAPNISRVSAFSSPGNQSHDLVTAGLFVLCSSSPPRAGDKGYGHGSGLLVNHNAIVLWDKEVFVSPRVGIEGLQMGRQSRMDSLLSSQVASPTVVTVSNMERGVEQPTIVFAAGSKEVVLDQSKATNHRQVRFVDHPSQKDLDRVARCIVEGAIDGSVRDPRVSSEPVRTSPGMIRVSNFVVHKRWRF
ncbi:hypothetical protein NE237_029254 [Protea cynaroides]|uniref:Uncharacterized protein n=1 Tax=Protea cynaroides TaxID=273540 RepID=A0A9Q0GUX5_9MAGN|nr:hypothetical protein NE237_029254 [Protea cynaroides]